MSLGIIGRFLTDVIGIPRGLHLAFACALVASAHGAVRGADPPGCMTMSPTSATVAQEDVTLTFTFTVGTNGFAEGGFIEILFNAMTPDDANHELFDFLMSPPQDDTSNGAGFVSACTALPGASDCNTSGLIVATEIEPKSRIALFRGCPTAS